MPKKENPNIIKSLILIGLLSSMFIFSAIVLSAYPQHLYVNNQTVIEASVGNFNNGTVNIRGNQVQYSSGSVIPLEGRNYIRITGNQVQFGGGTFISAIRTISAQIHQNILFEEKIGIFSINSAGKIIIDDNIINLIPVSKNIINIRTSDSNYNIEFITDTIYITSGDIMLKLIQNDNNIEVYLVGTRNYERILFVRI